jgi:CDP-6-deoxy-D-xylo-4-hexulose-3-dehydrase
VITSGLSWPTTLKPLLNHNLRPIFCDINVETLNMTVQTVEAVRSARTRAVVAVPVIGNPSGLDELKAYCVAQDLILIEDACESLGAVTAAGKQVGTLGLASAFSFYFSHHISTVEGGAILTDHDEVADICYALRSHGWTRHLKLDAFNFAEETVQGIDPRFRFFLPGYNVRATELTAAVGLVQLERLDGFVASRRRIAAGRIKAVQACGTDTVVPGAALCERHSWMTFPLLFPDAVSKRRGQDRLETQGIETRPIIVGNVLRHPIMAMIESGAVQPILPACDEVFSRGLMIGINPLAEITAEYDVLFALQDAVRTALCLK